MSLVDAQLRAAQLKLTILNSRPPRSDSPQVVPAAQTAVPAVDEYVDSDPRIQKQAEEVAQLEKALEELKNIVSTGHPKLEQAEKALSRARARLDKTRNERRTALLARVQTRAEQDAQAALRTARDEVNFLEGQLKQMRKAEEDLRKAAETTGIVAF